VQKCNSNSMAGTVVALAIRGSVWNCAQANTPMSREQSAADKFSYHGNKRTNGLPPRHWERYYNGFRHNALLATRGLAAGIRVWVLVLLFFCPFSLAAVSKSYGVFIAVRWCRLGLQSDATLDGVSLHPSSRLLRIRGTPKYHCSLPSSSSSRRGKYHLSFGVFIYLHSSISIITVKSPKYLCLQQFLLQCHIQYQPAFGILTPCFRVNELLRPASNTNTQYTLRFLRRQFFTTL
jgi:hypothetical protein